MWESIMKFIRRIAKREEQVINSKDAAKERLHLVLMQDRANVSADFLELMKQEIIEVIKKYIDVDETAIDVRLTNKDNGDGTKGAPALYANIPIMNIKDEVRQNSKTNTETVTTNSSESTQIEQTNDNNEEKQKEDEVKEENNGDEEQNQTPDNGEEIEEVKEIIHENQEEQVKEAVAQNQEN